MTAISCHAATAIVVFACLAAACSSSNPTAPAAADPVAHVPQASYAGPQACAACHPDIAATFHETGMGRSWYPLTKASAIEDFSRNNTVELERSGLVYRMLERDGRFFMRQSLRDASGREWAVDEREMQQVAGSGNHSRSYVTVAGGTMFQLPVCWYPALPGWDLCPGYEHKNDYFNRVVSTSCVFCHNARMEAVPGRRGAFREPIPEGIDCERCHGPGSAHVAKWKTTAEVPSGSADPTIVNPKRLPQPRRIQVCLQCHLGGSTSTERVAHRERDLESFRPGMDLGDVLVPFRYREPLGPHFGISAQADRFLLSRCYLESPGKFDCLHCHYPHVSVYSKERPENAFDAACARCHPAGSCPKADADCVRCHMRRGAPLDHPHTTFTDHWIRRDPSKEGAPVRGSYAIEPILGEAFETLPSSDRAYYTARAAFSKAVDVVPQARRTLWEEAERRFREAIEAGLDDAEIRYQLGRTLGFLGRRDEAARSFEAALAKDPAHAEAALNLAQILLAGRRVAEAQTLLERTVAAVPAHAGLLAELARCRAMRQDVPGALALYDRAIAIEPWTASLHLNRAYLLGAAGRLDEAARAAEEAVRRAPAEGAIWKDYAEILHGVGRTADAAAAAAVAQRLLASRPAAFAPRGMMGGAD
ncbi:MAG TPA: tetratricopeptide repeat protein [Candidatus Polarisedimenticolaceae bacterium]